MTIYYIDVLGLIAATARVGNLTVVTRNTADLERCGAKVVDPWA